MTGLRLSANIFLFLVSPLCGSDLALTETADILRISLRDRPVLEYVKTEKTVPIGMDDAYRRSGYIHPVFSPGGQEVSGDFPVDHPHQHGLFFAWTSTRFDDSKVDFWNLAKREGRVEHRDVISREVKDDQISVTVRHAFIAGEGAGRKDVLEETWTITVHRTPDDHFLFDLESVQQCATDRALTLPKFHYGGMAFRGHSQWLLPEGQSPGPGGPRLFTSEGKDRLEGNHTRPDWVAMTGKIDNKEATIVIMGHPLNFRAPQPVRLHPKKPYFCFAPMVTGEFQIKPGQLYKSRYRYLVTSAKADPGLIDKVWKDYQSTSNPAGSD